MHMKTNVKRKNMGHVVIYKATMLKSEYFYSIL